MCAPRAANPVGDAPSHVGTPHPDARLAGALALGLLTAGCGARSELALGEIQVGSACPAVPAVASTQRLGTGAVLAMTVDGAGYPVVAGTATGPLDFGEGSTLPIDPIVDHYGDPGDGQIFLARMAPAGCTPFALAFTSSQPSSHPLVQTMGVAVDAEGEVVLTVSLESPVDFGGGPVGATPYGPSAAIARFDASGKHVFSRGLAAPQGISVGQPAIDAQGNVLVGGIFAGALTLDGAVLGASTQGASDPFVIALDPTGALEWARILPLDGDAASVGTNLVNYPDFAMAAWPSGEVALGLRNFALVPEVMSALDASGQSLWQNDLQLAVFSGAVDASGVLTVVGFGTPNLTFERFDSAGTDLGGGAFPTTAEDFAFGAGGDMLTLGATSTATIAAEVDPSGNVVWTNSFPPNGANIVIPALGASARYVAGGFQQTVDFGAGTLTAAPAMDGTPTVNAFVARLPP